MQAQSGLFNCTRPRSASLTACPCLMMSYSVRETLIISLPGKLRQQLAKAAKRDHLTLSEFGRKAMQDKLWEDAMDGSRRRLAPMARVLGIYTDEDVFERFS